MQFVGPPIKLDLNSYFDDTANVPANFPIYNLAAVSQHYGGANNGHCRAIVQTGRDSWTIFDDGNVNAASADDVFQKAKNNTWTHHMLFYTQKEMYPPVCNGTPHLSSEPGTALGTHSVSCSNNVSSI